MNSGAPKPLGQSWFHRHLYVTGIFVVLGLAFVMSALQWGFEKFFPETIWLLWALRGSIVVLVCMLFASFVSKTIKKKQHTD